MEYIVISIPVIVVAVVVERVADRIRASVYTNDWNG
jgi:hypothetical protein